MPNADPDRRAPRTERRHTLSRSIPLPGYVAPGAAPADDGAGDGSAREHGTAGVADADAEANTATDAEASAATDANHDVDVDAAIETDTEPDTGTEPDTDADPDTVAEPDTDADPDTDAEPDTDGEPDTEADATGSDADDAARADDDAPGAATGSAGDDPTPEEPAEPTPPAPETGATPKPSRHRADLQGLRAIASLLVAVYHTWIGTVSGGVDIFFVVTGMLITTTLLGNVERHGRIRLPSYLLRLAGRLFPLAGIVLLAIAVTVFLVWPPFLWGQTFQHVFAAATYWENWNLARDATDYLAQDTAKSPVQHFWAMSVQGQFYLIWAAVIALAAFIAARSKRLQLRTTALVVVGLVTAASAAWAVYAVGINPVLHYYDTFARLWEFGVGAGVAILMKDRVLPRAVRWILGIVGLGLVLTAGFLPTDWSYPGPVALWPVTGAAFILLSHQPGASSPGLATRVLSWRPLSWLGGYSYGLYLWAWPLLTLYHMLFPDVEQVSIAVGTAIIVVAIVLSVVCIRGLRAFDTWRTRHLAPGSRRRHVSVVALLVPVVAIAAIVVPPVQSYAQSLERDRDEVGRYDTVEEIQAAVDQALGATALPTNLSPGLGVGSRVPEWVVDGCATVDATNMDACRYVDSPYATGEIVVIGDSQATSWVPGIRDAVDGRAAVQVMTREMCPVSIAQVSSTWQGIDAHQACIEHNAWTMQQIAERKPMLVVMSFGTWGWERVEGAVDAESGMTTLAEGTRPYLAELEALGQRTVWLDSSVPGSNTEACGAARTPEQYAETCNWHVGDEAKLRISLLRQQAQDFGVEYVTPAVWLCREGDWECPAFIGTTAVQADGGHLTWGMSRAVSPLVAEALHLDEFWSA